MSTRFHHIAAGFILSAGIGFGSAMAAERGAEQDNGSWQELREMIYDDEVVIADGREIISLDTPYRAHDAAIVPVEIEINPPVGLRVIDFTLIVEENPAPVAATFTVGEPMGQSVRLSTRVRVDAYSNVRVVAKLSDGSMWQVANFVKASGGCSAPSLKDAEAALANVGKMKVRLFDALAKTAETEPKQSLPDTGMREAQVMVRHPNYSGFQMNQVTRLFIPAYFVDELEVSQGDQMIFRMDGGISISEDPAIRFDFHPVGEMPLKVKAHDTEGDVYESEFPLEIAS
ncbi:quinoprotein dehydrogenase-associated SoxYZ-like carrier [Rhodobacteraceae bacterium NNCM2]|nr:quinoprotein dehydrogenase-associated SoxYZ-like carrier [Coraliihabitans acroporae]